MNDSVDDILNPDITTAEAAAAFWLVRRDQGATLEQDPNFAAWLSASQRNVQAWEKTAAVWDDFESADDPLLEAMRKDALSARRPPAYLNVRWAAIAAALIVMAGGIIGWNIFGRSSSNSGGQLVASDAKPTFVADASGPSTFALADGSLVTLDANSALTAQYDEKHRAVRLLRGHAFFRVVHNPARPFTAEVGANTISDLGTEFDVLAKWAGLSVTLINGSIAVASPGARPATLTPGQRLDATPGQPIRVSTVGIESALAWRTGYQQFSDEPLEKAIAQINRYGGAPARIVDPSIRMVRVSGQFRAGDPARFARTLAEIYPLHLVDRADGGVDITRR